MLYVSHSGNYRDVQFVLYCNFTCVSLCCDVTNDNI
jgi:hypothetical protein